MKNLIKSLYSKSLLYTVVFVTTVAALSGESGSVFPW
ncbi:hypothetical protein PAV_1c03630 [Paenibacillus alvei DSM 29]|nr:hypothetical protein PAV_1c03630 [Paenibacillus alvei DSM 29]